MNDRIATHTLHTHWRIERDEANLAWLHLDQQGTRVNTLSETVFQDLEAALDVLETEPPDGVIFISDKPSGFLAGADVNAFGRLQDKAEATALIRQGQRVMDRIERLSFPTVAAIHGYCLGGGLELALACDARVAESDDKTRLGLPEVRLGIHPGFGGTVRLARLIGTPAAMNLMLSARIVDAPAAQRLGLVDHAVPRRQLRRAAASLALDPPEHRQPRQGRLTDFTPIRPLAGWYLRRQTARQVRREHYPAPYALIDLWQRHGNAATQFEAEAESVAELITNPTTRNLLRVFHLRERLKGHGRETNELPGHVHVIGGGVMGADIAAWSALQGFTVTLAEQQHEVLGRALGRARNLFAKRLRERTLRQAAQDRLIPDPAGYGLRRADLVLEAIPERLGAKQDLFRAIEPQLKADAVVATNTSSIPLEQLAEALTDPGRLVGVHFFNPVAKMPLVEIVQGTATRKEIMNRAAAWAGRLDKLPLKVSSRPGFLVNRVLMPYLLEAVTLLDEGQEPTLIDRAALDFGMPMGPLALADSVGLDICLSVAENLAGSRGAKVPRTLRSKVDRGELGVKSGRGFYGYEQRRLPLPTWTARPAPDIQDRLMFPLLNEAVTCLCEGVVAEADELDAGLIFGAGFPPFRGGPIHYLRENDIHAQRQRLAELALTLGPRFEPDPGWDELARA